MFLGEAINYFCYIFGFHIMFLFIYILCFVIVLLFLINLFFRKDHFLIELPLNSNLANLTPI